MNSLIKSNGSNGIMRMNFTNRAENTFSSPIKMKTEASLLKEDDIEPSLKSRITNDYWKSLNGHNNNITVYNNREDGRVDESDGEKSVSALTFEEQEYATCKHNILQYQQKERKLLDKLTKLEEECYSMKKRAKESEESRNRVIAYMRKLLSAGEGEGIKSISINNDNLGGLIIQENEGTINDKSMEEIKMVNIYKI